MVVLVCGAKRAGPVGFLCAKAYRAQAVKVEEVLRKQTDPCAGRLALRLEHFDSDKVLTQLLQRVEATPSVGRIAALHIR
jgi:hypothetical protein